MNDFSVTHLAEIFDESKLSVKETLYQKKYDVYFINDFDLGDFTLNIYNDISVESGVLNFSKLIEADVIVLNTNGRRGLAHLFNGSIGEDLANHAKLPVVTFKL
mgnify:CR=1 FL=1